MRIIAEAKDRATAQKRVEHIRGIVSGLPS